jgi:hypothetical protein
LQRPGPDRPLAGGEAGVAGGETGPGEEQAVDVVEERLWVLAESAGRGRGREDFRLVDDPGGDFLVGLGAGAAPLLSCVG